MKTAHTKKIELYLLAILCTMLWGSAIPTIKLGYDVFNIMPAATADKLLFAGIRFVGASLLILIPYFIFLRNVTLSKALCTHSLILGLIQTAGQYFFMYIGLAWIIYKDEVLSKVKLIGCIISFSGIFLTSYIKLKK